MEIRTGHLFLMPWLLALTLWVTGQAEARAAPEESAPQPVLRPELDREPLRPARIDTEDFEVGIYVGLLSLEDFGSNGVQGARLAYHFSEDFFAEVSYARSRAGTTSFERLSGAVRLLTEEERELRYYNLSFGFNVLPGEAFVGSGRAFHTALYLIGGTGSTEFAGDDRHTLNLGFGYRFIFNDWLAGHLDVRDHIFDIDLLGSNKTSHNLEVSTGLTLFF